MEIRSEDRKLLVFNAYRFFDLVYAGNRLRIGELEDRWLHSGLRQSDLTLTLEELVCADLLRAEQTAYGMAYYLTVTGAGYIRENPETPSTRRELYQLARRTRSGSGLRLDRRRTAKV